MGRGLRLVLALVVVAAGAPAVLAHGDPQPRPVRVRGEVVDLVCYLAHGVRGPSNGICAAQHTTAEQPLALLAADGRVFVLAADHRSSYAYDTCRRLAGKMVELLGVPAERKGLRLLEVVEVAPVSEEARP